jgi:hypothetical protein
MPSPRLDSEQLRFLAILLAPSSTCVFQAEPEKARISLHRPGNCKTFLRPRPHLIRMKMQIDEILYELERAWEAGSLPGRQTAERNSIWRELHRRQLDRADCIRPRERLPLRRHGPPGGGGWKLG